MPVHVDMEAALARRGLKAREVAAQVGISETQFSLFRSGKIKGIRFATLSRLCAVLRCDLSDILTYSFDAADLTRPDDSED
ncbi:MAG: helix-turn-helix domain-containing protein [Asticcacaulis sp.]